eukprot:2929865-Pleurochrysis_carterae.AAC.3
MTSSSVGCPTSGSLETHSVVVFAHDSKAGKGHSNCLSMKLGRVRKMSSGQGLTYCTIVCKHLLDPSQAIATDENGGPHTLREKATAPKQPSALIEICRKGSQWESFCEEGCLAKSQRATCKVSA